MDHRNHVHARIAGPAEHFDDAASRGGVGVGPVVQIHDHQLPGLGGGIADQFDAPIHGLVVALDPAEVAFFAENPCQAAGAAAEHALDFAAGFFRGIRDEFAAGAEGALGARLFDGNEDAVAIERRRGVAAVDVHAVERHQIEPGGEVRLIGGIREKERMALGVEFQGAGE